MKNLYDPARVDEVKGRIAQLSADSPRQWGRMSPAQVVAHCSIGFEHALGDRIPERMPALPRLIGKLIKPLALGNDKPMRRNSPTAKAFLIVDEPDFASERERLRGLIDRFASTGPAGCTTHPHSFFGKLTPHEWAELMYKHLDHHLRQFGV